VAEPIDTDAFRKRHHPVNPVRYDGDADGLVTDGPAVCPRCATQGWPCDASRLADEVDRLRADVEYLARHESELAIKLTTANQKRYAAKAEVDRRRAENTALAAALEDIAGITYSPAHEVYVNGECHRFQDPPCHEAEPTDPEDWCITCVAEVAWCAWKMGALG